MGGGEKRERSARKRCINDPFYGSPFLNRPPYLECNPSQCIKTGKTEAKAESGAIKPKFGG